ncbi:hypothetical protein BRADI_4g14586v3 [Brachypodium distachyon]|uniref:Uncharacterized protein n=1 Tax=Brachypodium distachyon TaxID=15368 RepID=A0A0Q3HHS8_BRADI|nr:hypothetical protein BRADI_4g14586v3 [Brachypodium distachyon]
MYPRSRKSCHYANENHSQEPLGLSSWQKRKLQRLSAEELKRKNMAWVPKDKHKDNSDVQAVVSRRATKVKKENNKSNKQFSRMFVSLCQDLRLAHPPYSSNIPLISLSWISSPSMISNPSWIYWDPWMHHNSLYHKRRNLSCFSQGQEKILCCFRALD